jgi:hypothetical protein
VLKGVLKLVEYSEPLVMVTRNKDNWQWMEYDPDRIHRNSSVIAEIVHTAVGGDETCTELDFQASHAEYPADERCTIHR